MKKQVKVLSLVALCAMTSGLQAGFGTEAKPNIVANYIVEAVCGKRNRSLMMVPVAAAAAYFVHENIRPFRYDDKGTRSITEGTPSILADSADAALMGMGIAFMHNVAAPVDMSFKDTVKDTLLYGTASYAVTRIASLPTFAKFDRNHWLVRGWLPMDVKLDTGLKTAIAGYLVGNVVEVAWDTAKAHLNK